MRICIILPKGLPVPATKGGAIEKLVNDIIDENEKNAKLEITVVSIYDKGAQVVSQKYKETNFIYIKNDFSYRFKAILVRILNLFSKDKFNTYNEIVLQKIKDKTFNYIIVEDGAYMCFKSYLKYFNKEQMILHFHHNGKSDSSTDSTFSTYLGVSSFVASTFKSSSKIKDIQVLRNGIKADNFLIRISEDEKYLIREKYNLKKDDFVVIFCGRLIPEKGILELITAIKSINIENIKLLIVGSINFGINNSKSSYLELIENEVKNSNGRIVLTGYVDNSELYKYYQIADIGVIPSTWEDAAPLVLLEMMISKLPVIVTKTGGAPEYASKDTIIIPKDDDIVKNIRNNVLELYNNVKMRNEIIQNSYKFAKGFTTKEFYNDLVNILQTKERKSVNNEQK